MKRSMIVLLLSCLGYGIFYAATNIPADNPYIQYFGRWDSSNPTAPTHSWPGAYVYAEFEGTSIGIRTDDTIGYYNVFVDDSLYLIFRGTSTSITSYTLVSGLTDTNHKILLTMRNETNWTKCSFNGFILDDGKNLLPPPAKPERKIEFIGDSYSVASGNEWTEEDAAPNDSYTNNYKGFGSVIARNFNAQYQISARGGAGIAIGYKEDYTNILPDVFDRTLLYTPMPKWNFSNWVPNFVVICLGLNDYSNWGGYSGSISEENTIIFRNKYHEFISTILDYYPGVKILTVAANGIDWIKNNVLQVVAEENSWGHTNIFYGSFPYYGNSGYVNYGHPTVATDQKIADTIISIINTIDAWTPYQDVTPPRITKMPSSPFIVYDASYVLNIETDSYDTLHYSTSDKSFSEMENVFTTTETRSHAVTLSLQHGHEYTYYIRGRDLYGNAMDTSAVIHFSADTSKKVVYWTSLSYNDTQWKSGDAPLSTINNTSTATLMNKVRTAYFRRKITFTNIADVPALFLWIKGNDGTIISINGQELLRVNMSAGTEITYSTYALGLLNFSTTYPNPNNKLHDGENIITIEVHAGSSLNTSVSFDLRLVDRSGTTYIPFGSLWSYYDDGNMPSDQVVDRSTDVASGMENSIPKKMVLYANYPNPFNPTTTIRYELPTKSHVSMNIYDLLGREVTTLIDEVKPEGMYSVQFNAGSLSSGMYFCRLQAGQSAAVNKLLLVK